MKDIDLTGIYTKVPDLLLESITDVNIVLAKQNRNSESFKFWKRVADVMKVTYSYTQDMAWVHRQNETLKMENAFLKSMASDLLQRVNAYETIKIEKLSGSFDETVAKVDEFLKNGG